MVHQSLVDYIKQSIESGATKETITQTLIQTGWQQADIDDSFSLAVPQAVAQIEVSKPLVSSPVGNPVNSLPQQNYYHQVQGGGSKKWMLFFIPFVLLVVGAVWGYQMYNNTPDKILSAMIQQSGTIKTVASDLTINLTVEAKPNESGGPLSESILPASKKMGVVFSVKGVSDSSDLDNPKSSSLVSFEMKDPSTSQSTSVEAEIRALGEILYAKILDFASGGQKILPQYENKWIKIDYEELKKQYNVENKKSNNLTQDDLDKIQEAIADSNMMKDIKKLNDEKLHDQSMHHLSFEIDKTELKKAAQEISTIILKESSQQERAEFDKTLMTFLGDISFGVQEMWIGKNDTFLHQYKGTFKYISAKSDVNMEGNYFLDMKDHNKPVTIEVPTDSINLDELMKDIFGSPVDGTLRQSEGVNSPVLGEKTSSVSAQIQQEQMGAAALLNLFYLNDEASAILKK